MTNRDIALAISSERKWTKNRWSVVPRRSTGIAIARAVLLFAFMLIPAMGHAFDTGQTKTADGFTVYLGVIPAEIIRGYPKDSPERMVHGGTPRGEHVYHVVVSIFETKSGARITDAKVSGQVASLGLGGPKRELEPMKIADTVTYGNYFTLPGKGPYRIVLEITGPRRPVTLTFDYRH